ncbi:hypothetical protein GCM10011376_16130 [Nocardioides flavus (ex Wang et al. 2016)]|uniref:Uncharacterized protein n=1 Tax=Nocardioides flavus (ex Wang et al. 2016) TaxID=2058780 RepID=A0ABQ3HH80_9ACTN|nr:hypothetical protein GCM10011376_16130 [Nocardioides flavus (ex Wang et al. 2016)]
MAPRRTSETIWKGRQRLSTGTNQPPIAQPDPWRIARRSIRELRWAVWSHTTNSTPVTSSVKTSAELSTINRSIRAPSVGACARSSAPRPTSAAVTRPAGRRTNPPPEKSCRDHARPGAVA